MDFKFNGIANDSFEFELDLKTSNHLNKSGKRYESIQIPGRSENLIIDLGIKNNKSIKDTLYLQAPNGLKKAIDQIENWIQGTTGYKLLEYKDGYRYNAICSGEIEVEELFDNVAQITITYEASEVKE